MWGTVGRYPIILCTTCWLIALWEIFRVWGGRGVRFSKYPLIYPLNYALGLR